MLTSQTNALTASAQAANASAAALSANAQATEAMAQATAANVQAANTSAAALSASAQATQASAQATAANVQASNTAAAALMASAEATQLMARAAAQDLNASEAMAAEMARSAAATQAMAQEMLEARRAGNPLQLRIERREKHSGVLDGVVYNTGERAVVIRRIEIESSANVNGDDFGNAYLAPGGRGQPLRYMYDPAHGDLVTLRVTGRPSDGIEQTREFLFRILPDGTLEDLETKHWSASDGPISTLA